MSNYTINNLSELTGAVGGDYVALWDVSASQTKKVTLTNIWAAVMATANTFTAGQVIAPVSTSDTGFSVNMPSGTTASMLVGRVAGTLRALLLFSSTTGYFKLEDVDLGSGNAGSYVSIGRNNNATNGAGFIRMVARGGSTYRVWIDNAGNARVHTADPTNANDLAGTVIGTQTSMAEAKNLLGEVGDPAEALRSIVEAAKTGLRRFTYKSGSFNGEEFEGVVTDLAPRYGMDRDSEHPAGKSLNEVQLFADLIRAVALIAEKVGIEL